MRTFAVLGFLVLLACSSEPPPPPVTVDLAVHDERIISMLDEFADDTGIPVNLRRGDAGELTDALIHKAGDPADVLIADSIADVWRAADRGALRPIRSVALAHHHESLRDPDGLWFVLEIRPHAIDHSAGLSAARISYEDLGSPEFQGRLCLSTSTLPSNRALLANLIESRGELETERLVRRWVRNLAQAPYSDSAELQASIQAGTCAFGIVGSPHTVFGHWDVTPEPHSYEATAVGIGRHAPQPDAAQILTDWLLVNKSIRIPSYTELPRADVAGWRDEEARLLAGRAGYR